MMERSCSKKIINEVEACLEDEFGLSRNAKIAVGLSGGLDSVCLFHILLHLAQTGSYRIVAVHINHGIRGAEALRDEEFVKELCRSRHTELYTYRVDSLAKAKEDGISVEEAARELRYACFERALKESGAERIVLAHHADDSVETFLLNLARGSALKGLIGIPKSRGDILRPLLRIGREELLTYADENSVSYVKDSTNDENDYTRNRIRNLIVPGLCEHVNSATVRHIRDTIEDLQGVYEMLLQTVKPLSSELLMEVNKDCLVLNREKLKTYHSVLTSYTLSILFDEAGISKRNLTKSHYSSILDLAAKGTGKRLSLPNGMEARTEYNRLIIEKKEGSSVSDRHTTQLSLCDLSRRGELSLEFDGWEFKLECLKKSGDLRFDRENTEYFDRSSMDETLPLTLRYREQGDFMIIDEKGRKKKISRIFIDRKLSETKRKTLPLFAQESKVFHIPTLRRSGDSMVEADTSEILSITILKESVGRKDAKRE